MELLKSLLSSLRGLCYSLMFNRIFLSSSWLAWYNSFIFILISLDTKLTFLFTVVYRSITVCVVSPNWPMILWCCWFKGREYLAISAAIHFVILKWDFVNGVMFFTICFICLHAVFLILYEQQFSVPFLNGPFLGFCSVLRVSILPYGCSISRIFCEYFELLLFVFVPLIDSYCLVWNVVCSCVLIDNPGISADKRCFYQRLLYPDVLEAHVYILYFSACGLLLDWNFYTFELLFKILCLRMWKVAILFSFFFFHFQIEFVSIHSYHFIGWRARN